MKLALYVPQHFKGFGDNTCLNVATLPHCRLYRETKIAGNPLDGGQRWQLVEPGRVPL